MRNRVKVIVASLMLLAFAGECHAQLFGFSEPARLKDLKTAFQTEPRVWITQQGSDPYYDIAVKNVCEGAVRDAAQEWLNQTISIPILKNNIDFHPGNFLNRLMLISASVDFPDGGRPALREIPILVAGNTADVSWNCVDLTVQGIASNQRVQVTLKMIIVDSPGGRTIAVASAAFSALAESLKGGPVGAVIGLAGGITKAYADETKNATAKALLAGGRPFLSRPIMVGEKTKNPIPESAPPLGSVPMTYRGGVWGQEEWFRVERYPRQNLLSYTGNVSDIPRLIDLVSIGQKWEKILQDSGSPTRVSHFCRVFRTELGVALQNDPLAIQLGLYAHFSVYRALYPDDRANRGCLLPSELKALKDGGYIPFFGS